MGAAVGLTVGVGSGASGCVSEVSFGIYESGSECGGWP